MRMQNGLPVLFSACAAFALFAVPHDVAAKDNASGWHCRNPDLEISCPEGKCEVADAHTSMSVTANASELGVCAYSGCWYGVPAASIQTGQFHIFTGVRLLYMLDTDDGAHASLTIDTQSGIGTMLISGMYAQPMICKKN